MIKNEKTIQISVVYDNVAYDPHLKTNWGFSCFIEGTDHPILFDTGGDGTTLLSNLEGLDIRPQDVKILFLSHFHWDHVGGVEDFLSHNADVEVWIPRSFPDEFKKDIEAAGARSKEVMNSVTICRNAHSTGELGRTIIEQSLVVKTTKGLVVITGCAHPGIVEIVKTTKKLFQEAIYLVLGGFHLLNHSEADTREIIYEFQNLGVKGVAPSHCTGERAIKLFEASYGEDFTKLGAGVRISIE